MRRVMGVVVVAVLVGATVPVFAGELPPGGTFTDDDGNTHEGNIEAIAAAGITKGCNPPVNDLYCPSDPVTRGQMAAFLVRALHLTDDGGGNTFTDDDGSIFEADIAKLAAAGITKGCNPPANDQYCPDDPVLRDQMASFLARALDLTPIVPPPPTTTTSMTTTTTMATTTTTSGSTFAVDMADFFFSPDPVTVSVGTKVTWTNTQGLHTTTSGNGSTGTPDGTWDSGPMSVGDTFSVTFTTPGTYTYYCTFHWPTMTGTITVTG